MAVIGQSNHASARLAAEIAKANEARGADMISFALPDSSCWANAISWVMPRDSVPP